MLLVQEDHRMKGSKPALILIGLAVLTLGACSEQRARERWRDVIGRDEPRRDALDLNTASQKQLARLPGLTDEDAARIIANRPYGNKRGLVRRQVIGEGKYEKIERYVYVNRPADRDDDD
jgi:hypothetical protein